MCVCHVQPHSCCMLEQRVGGSCIPKQAAFRAQVSTDSGSHRIGLSNEKCAPSTRPPVVSNHGERSKLEKFAAGRM